MRALRWIGFGILTLAGLLLVATIGIYVASSFRIHKGYQIADEPITIPSDAASIERSRHLATTIGQCSDCHGENLAGKLLDPFMPYKYIGKLSDDELKAIYLYLKTVPAAAMGAR